MTKSPSFSRFSGRPLLAIFGGLLLLATACGSSSSTGNDAGGGGGASGGGDTTKYNFENGMTHAWASGGVDVLTSLMSSTAQKFQGSASLAANITATAAATMFYSADVNIAPPVAIAAGATVSFHVFVPTGAPIDWVQPYIQEDLTYAFAGTYTTVATTGGWMNIDVVVPALFVNPIYKMGVQIHNTDAYTGAVYIDSVNW